METPPFRHIVQVLRWWAWQIATASASAASAVAMAQPGSSTRTIVCTCTLSARPAPTTAFFTMLLVYSATGSPACAGTSSDTARACPSFSVETALVLTKVSSTAASSGR